MLFSTLYLFEFGTFVRNPNPPPSKGDGDMKEPNVLCQGLSPMPLPELSLPPTILRSKLSYEVKDYE